MSFIDNSNTPFYMPVSPAYSSGNSNTGNCFGGDSAWWLLVLLIALGGGWGNGFGNNNNMAPYLMSNNTNSDVQRGFDQQAVMGGIGDLNNAVTSGFASTQQAMCNGFANAEISNNSRQIANMQQQFANQSAMNVGFNNLSSQIAQTRYDNQLTAANIGALVQSENCEDRNALNNGIRDVITNNTASTQRIVDTTNEGFRSVYDKLCQMESDNIKRDYENRIAALENALQETRLANQNARFDASQNNQTATIQAGQRVLANEIEQYVNPVAKPAYIVQNPNCCPTAYAACGGCN